MCILVMSESSFFCGHFICLILYDLFSETFAIFFSSQGSSVLDITSGGNMKVSTLCFIFNDTEIELVDLFRTMSSGSLP